MRTYINYDVAPLTLTISNVLTKKLGTEAGMGSPSSDYLPPSSSLSDESSRIKDFPELFRLVALLFLLLFCIVYMSSEALFSSSELSFFAWLCELLKEMDPSEITSAFDPLF